MKVSIDPHETIKMMGPESEGNRLETSPQN